MVHFTLPFTAGAGPVNIISQCSMNIVVLPGQAQLGTCGVVVCIALNTFT